MSATDEIYREISRQRWRGGVYHEVEEVIVAPDFYNAAYVFMHGFCLHGDVVDVEADRIVSVPGPHYPLPVPEDGYRLFGVVVRKAEIGGSMGTAPGDTG